MEPLINLKVLSGVNGFTFSLSLFKSVEGELISDFWIEFRSAKSRATSEVEVGESLKFSLICLKIRGDYCFLIILKSKVVVQSCC